jgi:hypothetical protein
LKDGTAYTIEDLLYGLTVSALLSGLDVKQRWAQSVRGWVTGAYNALFMMTPIIFRYELELDRLNECLSYLKRIHLLKTSPDVLKKIFHNLPLISNSEQVAKQKTGKIKVTPESLRSHLDRWQACSSIGEPISSRSGVTHLPMNSGRRFKSIDLILD